MFSNLVWIYGEWRMHGNLKLKALCVLFPFPKWIWSIQFSLAMTKITSSFTAATRLVLKSYRRLLWTSPGPSTLSITVPVLSTRTDWLCRFPSSWTLTIATAASSGFFPIKWKIKKHLMLYLWFVENVFVFYHCRIWDAETGLCLREIQEPGPTRYYNLKHLVGWESAK